MGSDLPGEPSTGNAHSVALHAVELETPADVNVILGQAHFIKTVDDLHEAIAGSVPGIRFGIAFCEASGPRLVRCSGNDDELVEVASANALAVGAGHAFLIVLRDGYPVNVLNAVKGVPEVCGIFCASANRVQVLVAQTASGRGIVGVIDGEPALAVEGADDVESRRALLRELGYKP
jgi:uncharacterized protein